MKKKLALLLAAVMTMSMLPVMNVFAATDNRLEKPVQYVPKKTLFVETGTTFNSTAKHEFNDIKYVVDGNNLVMETKDTLASGTMFRLQLDNAKWFFRNNNDATKDFKQGTDVVTTYVNDPAQGTYAITSDNGGAGVYTRTGGSDVKYTLEVPAGSPSTAIVKIQGSAIKEKNLVIPLVVLSNDEENDIRVTVVAGDAKVSQGTYTFGTSSGGATVAKVDDPKTARDNFPLNSVVINEARIGSFAAFGGFEIIAPNGFSFEGAKSESSAAPDGVKASAIPGYAAAKFDFAMKPVRTGEWDPSTLVVTVTGGTKSTGLAGGISIEGLKLVAEDNAPKGDIMMRVRETSTNGLGVSDQTFIGGTRVDWSVGFTAATAPELVSGRYDTSTSISDDRHRTADVTFKELAINSWWAGKQTVFSLPEGVKFRKVEFDTKENVKYNNGAKDTDGKVIGTDLKDQAVGDNTKAFTETGVKIDGNTLTLSNMIIPTDKKAKLVMKIWVSVAAGYTGPIALSVNGSAVGDDLAPVTIANAIAPVTLTTKVTDVKIGYQYQPVADITITETKAGILEKGKDLNISISDLISDDMSFSSSTKVAVTDGDLKIKDATVGFSGGSATGALYSNGGAGGVQIVVPIDRASSKASTITVTNAAVKINRSIPESNEKPYEVVVWGTAIAANYNALATAPIDTFSNYPGIRAPYVAVVSAANDKTGVLTGEVRVSIGQSTYSVNGKASEMPVAPYISTKSNSTMVPLRFVANAFGIDDSAVLWDNTLRTVTIIHPTRSLQFKVGSSVMTVNNNPVTMTSPDGKAVSAEITNERTFVPFRAIGEAFGIQVAWDAATQTAIYNPGGQVANTGTVQTGTLVDTTTGK